VLLQLQQQREQVLKQLEQELVAKVSSFLLHSHPVCACTPASSAACD
jgi:hypothetical protein